MLCHHLTVGSALQATARLARASPLVAVVTVPVDKVAAVAERQVGRYPSIGATHVTRTALRQAGMPAVQLVVMPPGAGAVDLLLWSNRAPDARETWRPALDPERPLTWRNYQLARHTDGRVTWRLSPEARARYRTQIARTINGRGGPPGREPRPHRPTPDAARTRLLQLAAHLQAYPGFSGVRRDVFDLAQYSTKLWRSAHGDVPHPTWPTMPFVRFRAPSTAPLAALNPVLEVPHAEQKTPNLTRP